jgi:hypothetical protein
MRLFHRTHRPPPPQPGPHGISTTEPHTFTIRDPRRDMYFLTPPGIRNWTQFYTAYENAAHTYTRDRHHTNATRTLHAATATLTALTTHPHNTPATHHTDTELADTLHTLATHTLAGDGTPLENATHVSSTITSRLDITASERTPPHQPTTITQLLTRHLRTLEHHTTDPELAALHRHTHNICTRIADTAAATARQTYHATLLYWSDTDGLITITITGHTAGNHVHYTLDEERITLPPQPPIHITCDGPPQPDGTPTPIHITFLSGNQPVAWITTPAITLTPSDAAHTITITTTPPEHITLTATTPHGTHSLTPELAARISNTHTPAT